MTQVEIRDLIQAFSESDLTSLRYQSETESLTLKRQKERVVSSAQPVIREVPEAKAVAAPEPAPAVSDASGEKGSDGISVTAPIAGVFYRASKPGEEPYVREGTVVKKGQTLGLMEAMKLMSEIPSPCDGIVRTIEVENGAFAEFGTTLLNIEEQHV